MDNALQGVNAEICDRLGLKDKKILILQSGTIKKLTTYVPKKEAEQLRDALFTAGAGHIGNYSHCSFNTDGVGTFLGTENTNPTIGEKGEIHQEHEVKMSMIFAKHLESKIIKTLLSTHSYEEVAYEIVTIENKNQDIGMGMIAELDNAISETDFLNMIKEK